MAIKQRYITAIAKGMENRVKLLRKNISLLKKEIENEEVDSYGVGLRKGHITAWEQEIKFLEGHIKFISGERE